MLAQFFQPVFIDDRFSEVRMCGDIGIPPFLSQAIVHGGEGYKSALFCGVLHKGKRSFRLVRKNH